MSRERRLLVLSVLLVLAIAYFVGTRGLDVLRPSATLGPGGSSQSRNVLGAEIMELRTGDLQQKPGTYRPGRDLFSYGGAVPAPRPTPPRVEPPRPKPQVEAPEPETEAAPEPQPPPVDVIYLGSFGRSGNRIAVFADDEAIYNAMVGDVVKDVFVLVNIGYESVDLGFVDFPDAEAERLAVGGS